MALLAKKKYNRNTHTSYGSSQKSVSRNTRLQEEEKKKASSIKEQNSYGVNKKAFVSTMWWFASAITAVTCMAFLAFGFFSLTHYVMSHPYFSIENIYVDGMERFSQEEIVQLSGIEENDNVFAKSLQEIQSRLLQNPWIEEAIIIRQLPNTMHITVKEREPRFFTVHNKILYYLDSHARLIAPVESHKFISLPILDIGAGADEALVVLSDFLEELELSHLPFDLQTISWLHLSAGKGFEMYWENKKLTLSIGVENWKQNLENIVLVIQDLEKRNELGSIAEIRADNNQAWLIK